MGVPARYLPRDRPIPADDARGTPGSAGWVDGTSLGPDRGTGTARPEALGDEPVRAGHTVR